MSSATLPAPIGTKKELRTRQAIACTTSATHHVGTNHGHHELVYVGLPVSFEMHFTLRCTCTTVVDMARVALALEFALDQHHSLLTSNFSTSACSQTYTPNNSCAMISMMLTTASGCPCHEVCVSIAHLQDAVDARRNPARHSGAVRSSARCWHVSRPDAGHHASTCSTTMCG